MAQEGRKLKEEKFYIKIIVYRRRHAASSAFCLSHIYVAE